MIQFCYIKLSFSIKLILIPKQIPHLKKFSFVAATSVNTSTSMQNSNMTIKYENSNLPCSEMSSLSDRFLSTIRNDIEFDGVSVTNSMVKSPNTVV